MAKLTVNALLATLQGTVGDLVIVREGDQLYVRRRGKRTQPLSSRQTDQIARFAQAIAWARSQVADPEARAAYQSVCCGHLTPFNVAIRDFFHPPMIERIELESYGGKIGDPIVITAIDDFRVARVEVTIWGVGGDLIEEGWAQLRSLDQKWVYWSQTQIEPPLTVRIQVAATDLPGNQGSKSACYCVED